MYTNEERYEANLACLERQNKLIEEFVKTPQKREDVLKYRQLKAENDIEWGKAIMMKVKA